MEAGDERLSTSGYFQGFQEALIQLSGLKADYIEVD